MEGHDRADGEKMGRRDKWLDRTKETAGERKKEEQKGDGEGRFATFSMVNDCLDKAVQIEFTRTNARHHSIMFQDICLKSYTYTLIQYRPLLIGKAKGHQTKSDYNCLD